MTAPATFEGRRAVVTGANSGIGKAVAAQLTGLGCEVIGVDRQSDSGPSAVSRMLTVDLTSAADRARLLDEIAELDLLVNAAGISITRELQDTTEDDWNRTLEINAKVPFLLMQALGERMPAGGAIVNIASVAGRMATNIQGAPYNASKAAVIALTKTFAYALANRGVRVNAVCPGVTDTPMLTGIFAEQSALSEASVDSLVEQYLHRVPLGRLGRPSEIADAVVFLLSDQAAYITGQSFNVCGGLVMS